jgi:hypothetical protein
VTFSKKGNRCAAFALALRNATPAEFVVVDKVVSLACSVVKLLQLQQIIEPTSL